VGLGESEPPHERTFKSSTSKIPTERDDRPIQNGQTDHLRLQVAVKRGTLLSGETKDEEVHRGSDAHGVFESRVVVLIGNGIHYMVFFGSVSVFFFFYKLLMSQYSKWVARPRSDWAAKEKNWGA